MVLTPMSACFLALLVFMLQRYCRGAGVRRPPIRSLTMVSREIQAGTRVKLYVKLFFSTCSIFQFVCEFVSFSLTRDHIGDKISKRYFSHWFGNHEWSQADYKPDSPPPPTGLARFQPNFLINMLLMRKYRLSLKNRPH